MKRIVFLTLPKDFLGTEKKLETVQKNAKHCLMNISGLDEESSFKICCQTILSIAKNKENIYGFPE